MGKISDFFPGVTKTFSVTCRINGSAVDITSDTVTVRVKTNKSDTDANALISSAADVATSGASGIALFTLSAAATDIAVGSYFIDIEWVRSDSTEHVIYNNMISCVVRVSDS